MAPLLRELALQVAALGITEVAGDLVEPAVDGLFVDVQFRHALFVEQWCHGFVLHRTLHGVGVDDGAELIGSLRP